MEIKERVQYLRKTILKMTQREFGEKIGLDRTSIASIETGKSSLTDRNISMICNHFGISEEWLRHENGDLFAVISTDEQIVEFMANVINLQDDHFMKRLIIALSKMTDEQGALFESLIYQIAGVNQDSDEK